MSYNVLGYRTLADLVILDMEEFDIIMGISLLGRYHAIFYCYTKIITIVMLGMERLKWEGTVKPTFFENYIGCSCPKVS